MEDPTVIETEKNTYVVEANYKMHQGALGIAVIIDLTDSLGGPVAAKCFRRASIVKPDHVVQEEAKKLYQLEHKNLVKLYDICFQKDLMWIFMESCAYGNLGKYFREKKNLSLVEKLTTMKNIAEGIQYLHSKDIIHRDIKPENILMSYDSNRCSVPKLRDVDVNKPVHDSYPTAKLADFGLSKFLDPDAETFAMSPDVGITAFKAPEFFDHTKEGALYYRRNGDVFAAGLTFLAMLQYKEGDAMLIPQIETPMFDSELFEPIGRLLAKRKMFGVGTLDVLEMQELGKAEGTKATQISEVRKLIAKMVQVGPEDRPSASSVLEELKRIIDIPYHNDDVMTLDDEMTIDDDIVYPKIPKSDIIPLSITSLDKLEIGEKMENEAIGHEKELPSTRPDISGFEPSLFRENEWDKEDSMESELIEDSSSKTCEGKDMETRDATGNSDFSLLKKIVKDSLPSDWQIVNVLSGGAFVVQAPHSDVQLHVPEGIHGVLLGNIHTNHSKFLHQIPDDHCILGPICEYQYFPSPKVEQENGLPFKLLIPHILEDINQKKDKIRVRCDNIHDQDATLTNIPLRTEAEVPSFEVDDKFIIIHTSHFCNYIVTAEGLNCCARAVKASLFGNLDDSLASVKVCFTTVHNKLKDYYQTLKEEQALFNMFPVGKSDLTLSTSEYDASRSTMEITLEPEDSNTWKPFMDLDLRLKKKLNEVWIFENGHLCKRPMTELSDFVLKTSQPNIESFLGTLTIKLHIGMSSDENRNRLRYREEDIDTKIVVIGSTEYKKDTHQMVVRLNTAVHGPARTAKPEGSGVGNALSDVSLMKLAKKIKQTSDLTSLGLNLGLTSNQVKTEIKNNNGDWVMAAFEVLQRWRDAQGNPGQGIQTLRQVLRDSGMSGLIF